MKLIKTEPDLKESPDKDSLMNELKYNIREKQRFIEILLEEIYQLKSIKEN